MYTAVLMMALTAGSQTPDSCRRCHGGCHGCYSCYSSCYSYCYGCYGCSGCYRCSGCYSYGCSGCYGCYSYGGVVAPRVATVAAAPATIVVSLPENARLIVDGTSMGSTTNRRTLVSPNLEVGSSYVYTFRAEIVRDGVTVAETKEVTVRAGETFNVQLNPTSQGVASR